MLELDQVCTATYTETERQLRSGTYAYESHMEIRFRFDTMADWYTFIFDPLCPWDRELLGICGLHLFLTTDERDELGRQR
eukprot:5646534-Pyramimonas_sp.AAC.1